MAFNLGSKNNMGAIATIILIILLSQSRFFNFLIDTALGRVFLLAFILAITCMNKILGVIIVLFIMIMFNQSTIGYMEGFTTDQKDMSKADVITDKKETNKDKGREGFNTVDREGTILRGKKSNEIPVYAKSRSQSDDVEPADKGTMKETYSSV
jgi:hypothetical protein